MDSNLKNPSVKGFWWKRFFYSVTGATDDYELGPNWFASVMGTGIIANAAVSLPLFSDKLHGFALIVWCLASFMLIGLVLATLPLSRHRQNVWKKNFRDPMMAQFFGAPPMAMLTIGGGTLLLGHHFIGQEFAQKIAWTLWFLGTMTGLGTAVILPYLMFTRFEVRQDSAFGGWLMPVVPPMVSAAIVSVKEPFNPDNKENEI